jgi:trimeric autotransporter adhesin
MKQLLLFFFVTLVFQNNSYGQIITTTAGTGISTFNGDGIPATDANMSGPNGLVVDKYGNLYISSYGDCRIRKVSVSGIISTFAGNGTPGFSGDGGMATDARIDHPKGISIDKNGNLYICDSYNNRIRKVDTSGIITTVAGNGNYGYSGDGGQATDAKIWGPTTLFIDDDRSIFFADSGNDRIRKVGTDGIISTIAGTGVAGYNGDNIAATAAMLNSPTGIARDKNGHIYICDNANKRIRKIDNAGIITTVVGIGTSGYSGDNGPATDAKIIAPMAIIFDNGNNMYFIDMNVYTIRKVSSSGIITTIAGTPYSFGFSGDGGPATTCKMNGPNCLAFDNGGGIYVADFGNKRVRYINNVVAVSESPLVAADLQLFPNPSDGHFAIKVPSSLNENVHIQITDIAGKTVQDFTSKSNELIQTNIEVPEGIYFMSVIVNGTKICKKLVVQKSD